MNSLKALIKISLLEFLRDRIVWIFVFVGLALYGLSLILGSLSFQEQQRILAHFGWMAIIISNLGIVLFLGSNWLNHEMTNQTCLLVLARPVSREQFYLGKFFGIWVLSVSLQFLMTLTLWFFLKMGFPGLNFTKVFFGTLCEVSLVLALSFFAATFTRNSIAFLFGLGVFLIGHWMQEIEFFGQKIHDGFYVGLAQTLRWIVPNLFQMNWRSVYFLENGIPTEQILWVAFHSLAWILFSVVAGMAIFRRKDLV